MATPKDPKPVPSSSKADSHLDSDSPYGPADLGHFVDKFIFYVVISQITIKLCHMIVWSNHDQILSQILLVIINNDQLITGKGMKKYEQV
jgi:hypothetical protein